MAAGSAVAARRSSLTPFVRRPIVRSVPLIAFVDFLVGTALFPTEPSELKEGITLKYPHTRKGDQVDDYHGTTIGDPYRWLEDPDSPETQQWVTAQNRVTEDFLSRIPQRERIKQRLTELWDYERFGLPRKRGNRYFYEHNDGLQNQAVLYVAESLDGEPRVLIDPNKLSHDGTIALAGWRLSHDGEYIAIGLGSAGSDWREWRVLHVATGRELPDRLNWIKFSDVTWTKDNSGMFYSRYDQPETSGQFTQTNHFQTLYFHRLGDPQSQDLLIYERKDHKKWAFDSQVTEDGRYLVIDVWQGTERKNQVFYRDLQVPEAKVVEMIVGFDAEYHFLGNDGPVFWFLTDLDAPLRRVIAVDIRNPDRESWRELIAESRFVLSDVGVAGDRFFAEYLEDAKSRVKVYDLSGNHISDVPLPGLGTADGFRGRRDQRETFFTFSNHTTPTTVFRYDITNDEVTIFRSPKVNFRADDFETTQIFFASADGTRVPMFLTHKKGLQFSGQDPTLLYGYGGFNTSLTPWFDARGIVWLEMGGVLAMPNLRGGGEYGRTWHEAGIGSKKQNVFDDFLAAAQWLIDNRITCREKLAIHGRSNGGLLVGAAMTQRPDLFAAAVPSVAVLDMLRYHKFTIGWAWVSEFGSADDAEEFKTLLAYSPLHNLQPGVRYPATLITTADHDDRVVPAHSYKFAAALQAAQAEDDPPTLIRIDVSAGHGAGKPISKLIDETTDVFAFLASVLDVGISFRTLASRPCAGSCCAD